DQEVVKHLEQGLSKQAELSSGLRAESHICSGNSLNPHRPSRPEQTHLCRVLHPPPQVALHCSHSCSTS
ncbi:hypothetical protein J4Q44_G00185740, partial [Coregonus suidteri]